MEETDKRVGMAWEEYKLETDLILRFDQIIFNIKSWSVTTFAALLAIYYTKPLPGNPRIILYLHIATTLLYWFLEYMYKRFQSFHITRSRLLNVFLGSFTEYDTYRVPDNLFMNRYERAEEQRILQGRNFRLNSAGTGYVQSAFRWQFALQPQTSAIYLFQIACSTILMVFL